MRVPVHVGVLVAVVLVGFSLSSSLQAAPIVFADSGTAPGDVLDTVDQFRTQLGTLNGNLPGSFGSGRREINWDGVPDNRASPNAFPFNFFNQNAAGTARGVEFTTSGTGFEVSAALGNPTATPVQFGNINPLYPSLFEPFSPQRLFTATGSTTMDVNFFIPGSSTPAVTTGFGVVFSDVDATSVTSLSFFDPQGNSLGDFFAPPFTGNETFSFLGVAFNDAVVGRVRITSGNQILSARNSLEDLVVMDDFVYGEPRLAAVPEPSTLIVLGGLGLLGLPMTRRRQASGQRLPVREIE